ncbi:MAG: alpha/beta fold hydrolase [Solirubrobacterales bacterium]
MADFLLIHGAWHGGWCWDRVVPLLEAAGHGTFAPTLSGLEEERTEPVDGIGMGTHVEDVLRAASGLSSDRLILVGHSYGGFPMTGAADRLRERVALYVYLDAGVPDGMSPGTSFAWCDGNSPEEREKRLEAIVDLGLGPVLPTPPPEAFGVQSAADRELLAEKTRPMPAATFTDRFTLESGGTDGLDRAFVHSIEPAYPPLGETPDRIQADPSWEFHELRTGHDSMLMAPEALADLLDKLAGS